MFTLKKKLSTWLFAAGLAVAGASTAHAAPVTIKYGAYHSSSETFITAINDMMDAITERTNGDVVFEPYYAGSLLKAQDLYPGLSRGAVDMVTSAPQAFNPRDFPLSGVTLPFMTEDVIAATRAFHTWFDEHPEVQAEFERNGAHLLLGVSLAENVIWTKKQIKTADDLKGMRIRMLLGPGEALSILGATAVATPYTEAIDLLQRGGVDGISTTFFDQGVRDGLGDVAEYVSSGARMGVFAIMLTSVRKDLWDSLPADTQAIFNEEASKAMESYFEKLDETVDAAVAQLSSEGKVKVGQIDDAEAQKWRELTDEKLKENYIERAKRVNVDGQALLDSFQSIVTKYESQSDYVTGIDRYLQSQAEN